MYVQFTSCVQGRAIIQNNTYTENNVLLSVYYIINKKSICFYPKQVDGKLAHNEIIQNNTLTENNISSLVYRITETSIIQLNNVAFSETDSSFTCL